MKPIELVLSKLDRVKGGGPAYQARCPAHEDGTPSLSVKEARDGRVLIKCHAGCQTEDVVEAIGLSMGDLFPDASRTNGRAGSRIVETYDYTDEVGNRLFQTVRLDPKDFRQRRYDPSHPDAKGDGWVWSLKGVRRVLYRLPRVVEASQAGGVVYVVEGEKDVHALERMGVVATCNPMGAGKWRAEYAESLRGAHAVILPDNDEVGREHARTVARSLHGVAESVRVVELPGLPEKGDVSDWLAAGGTLDMLSVIVEGTEVFTPSLTEASFRQGDNDAGTEDDERPALPAFAYDRLPETLRKACAFFPKWYECDVYLTALIGAFSAVLPNVRLQYSKTYYSPHLFVFVLAHAASGKGVMQFAFRWLTAVDELLLKESAEEHQIWEAAKRAYEDARKRPKSGKPTPDPPGSEPPEHCLIAGEDMSAASIARRLVHNAEGVFVGCTEADAVSRANGKDWGGFSDVLRRAFHHESVRVDRSTSETIRVLRPRLALALSGTPDQFGRLVDSLEDGLFSRFAVYQFAGERRYESQRPTPKDTVFEEHLAEMQQWVLKLYEALRSRTEPLYVDVDAELWGLIDDRFRELFERVRKTAPALLDATVKRGALIAFRVVMVLAVLRHYERGADLRRCRSIEAGREDVQAACALALVFTEHGLRQAVEMLRASGRLPDGARPDVSAQTLHRMTGKQRGFFDALPHTFGRPQAEALRAQLGFSNGTLYNWLNGWIEAGLLTKPDTGQYIKNQEPVLESLESLENRTDSAENTALLDGKAVGELESRDGEVGNSNSLSNQETGHDGLETQLFQRFQTFQSSQGNAQDEPGPLTSGTRVRLPDGREGTVTPTRRGPDVCVYVKDAPVWVCEEDLEVLYPA